VFIRRADDGSLPMTHKGERGAGPSVMHPSRPPGWLGVIFRPGLSKSHQHGGNIRQKKQKSGWLPGWVHTGVGSLLISGNGRFKTIQHLKKKGKKRRLKKKTL